MPRTLLPKCRIGAILDHRHEKDRLPFDLSQLVSIRNPCRGECEARRKGTRVPYSPVSRQESCRITGVSAFRQNCDGQGGKNGHVWPPSALTPHCPRRPWCRNTGRLLRRVGKRRPTLGRFCTILRKIHESFKNPLALHERCGNIRLMVNDILRSRIQCVSCRPILRTGRT